MNSEQFDTIERSLDRGSGLTEGSDERAVGVDDTASTREPVLRVEACVAAGEVGTGRPRDRCGVACGDAVAVDKRHGGGTVGRAENKGDERGDVHAEPADEAAEH